MSMVERMFIKIKDNPRIAEGYNEQGLSQTRLTPETDRLRTGKAGRLVW